MQDIQIGDPQFDESFIIKGSDEMIVRSFLSFEIRAKLLEINKENPYLEVKKNDFVLRVPKYLREDIECDLFIDIALAIVGKISDLG